MFSLMALYAAHRFNSIPILNSWVATIPIDVFVGAMIITRFL